MNKIALCLSGQPRSVSEGYEYIKKNLLDMYDVDVFTHSWFSLEEPFSNEQEILNLYHPKNSDFNIPFDKEYFSKYTNVANPLFPAVNTFSMFFSIYQANLCRKIYEYTKNITYDVVIRSRYDYALNNSELLYCTKVRNHPEKVFVPNDRMTDNHDFCADMFAFGSPKVMDKYCNTFNHLDLFYDKGFIMNAEEMLAANLAIYGLTGRNMEYVDMNNPFPPGPYNGNRHSIIRDDFKSFNTLRG